MAEITTASGTKISIGPAATDATDTASEYAALNTYVPIGLVESLGEFGDESSSVSFAALGDGRTRKTKGARDAGNLALTCAVQADDPGQAALLAAELTNNKYAFKVEYPDKPNPTGTNTIEYFRALVMSKRKNVGSNDNIIKFVFTLGIDSAIVTVPATAGA